MPTRYLKSGIRDSELIDSLSPLAETLYYRLIVTVDDFGRFDARPSMIKAQCFPIKDAVDAKICKELLNELAKANLIDLYEVDGKPYLQVHKWDNAPRAKESKFPQKQTNENESHTNAMQTHTTVCKPRTLLPLTETETVTVTKTEAQAPDGFINFWQTYPNTDRKQSKGKCLEGWKKARLEAEAAVIINHVDRMKKSRDWTKNNGEFIPAPLVYLNQKRWQGASEVVTEPSEFAGSI